MTKFIGRLIDVGIGKETVRGAGAAPTFYLPKATFDHDDKILKVRSPMSFGNIGMDGNQAHAAGKWGEGSLEAHLHDQSFGLILRALLGSVSTSGPTDSAYTHTFALASTSNQHQSLALSVNQPAVGDLMYKLAMIDSLEIKIVPEDIVTFTVNFMSKSSVDTTITSAIYIAENKFLGRHLSFKIAALTSNLAAASNIPVRSLTLKFEKNLRRIQNTGTVQPQDIINQAIRITGQVELDYEDRTYVNYMLNDSFKAVRIQLTNTEALIGAATRPSLKFDFSRVDFDQWEPDLPNDDVVSQSFNFTALYDITNSDIINSCTLVNSYAGTNY
jgi:hypothetical protein